MSSMSPATPVRADHRFIHRVIETHLPGKVQARSTEYKGIAEAFLRLGGSWTRVFLGSPEDVIKLKRIIKVAYKQGYLTRQESWSE